MINLLLLIFAILFSPTLASAQCNGVFPSSTLCGTASAAGVPGPVSLGTFLSSANNNAPVINIFDTAVTTVCCAGQLNVISSRSHITGGAGNAIVGSAIQDANLGIATFPTGVTGYGLLTTGGAGSYVFGVFGRVDVNVAGSGANEFDCNNSNADSPNTFPPNLGFPVAQTYCLGVMSVNIGTKISHSAFRSVATGALWLASYYADPISSSTYGLFIDSDATHGPISSAQLRNTGSGVNLTLQTMGTFTPANAVMQTLDVSSNVIWKLGQDGSVTVNVAKVGGANYSISNTDTGASSAASYLATTNAGTISMLAATSAGGSGAVFKWTGSGSFFLDAQNAAGNISIRTGATPTAALNISAAGLIQVPLIATGTPVAAACFDASNNLIKKVGTSC